MQFAMAINNKINGWMFEGPVGSGGFGSVQVLRNEQTNEYIALKISNKTSNAMSDKERERWIQECKIMLRLNHQNVVKGLPLPAALHQLTTDLPVLVMEYCRHGNLRVILSKAENACGLSERKVRFIAQDMTAAIEYLHSEKIIHRDIKPENIVLSQEPGNRVIYKLIDLGYAKDLSIDQNCQSYVGTFQYLAPELLTNKNYNNTVDYWCLGMVVFECIAGFRPFQQQQPSDPRQWLQVIARKSKLHISATVSDQGDTVYSDKLPIPNQLCSMSQSYFEQWLRLLLLYDPDKRGGGPTDAKNPKPQCFSFLERILTTKLIHIYSVPTNEVVSFPVVIEKDTSSQAQLLEVFAKIFRNRLGVSEQEQEFITRSGSVAPQSAVAEMYCCTQEEEGELEDIVDVYMVCRHVPFFEEQHYKIRQYPARLDLLVQNSDKESLPKDKKETVKHAVYYCNLIYLDFLRLLDAHKAMCLCISRQQTLLTDLISQLRTASEDLKTRTDIFIQSSEVNIAEFKNLHQSKAVYSQSAVDRWTKKKNEVAQNAYLGKEVEKCIAFRDQINIKVLEHQRNPCVSENVKADLQKFKIQAHAMYSNVRTNNSVMVCPTIEIIRCVEGCKDKFRQLSKDVCSQIWKLLACKTEMINKEPQIKNLLENVKKASEQVNKFQRVQQRDVWSLYGQTIDMFRNKSGGSSESNSGSPTNSQPPSMTASNPAAAVQTPAAADDSSRNSTPAAVTPPVPSSAARSPAVGLPTPTVGPQSVSSWTSSDNSGSYIALGGPTRDPAAERTGGLSVGSTDGLAAGPTGIAAVSNLNKESSTLIQESYDLRNMLEQAMMNMKV